MLYAALHARDLPSPCAAVPGLATHGGPRYGAPRFCKHHYRRHLNCYLGHESHTLKHPPPRSLTSFMSNTTQRVCRHRCSWRWCWCWYRWRREPAKGPATSPTIHAPDTAPQSGNCLTSLSSTMGACHDSTRPFGSSETLSSLMGPASGFLKTTRLSSAFAVARAPCFGRGCQRPITSLPSVVRSWGRLRAFTYALENSSRATTSSIFSRCFCTYGGVVFREARTFELVPVFLRRSPDEPVTKRGQIRAVRESWSLSPA